MKRIEINCKGNFKSWPSYLLEELKKENKSRNIGEDLIFEDNSIRIWNIMLLPGERLPFRHINTNFSFISLTNSMVIMRSGDGSMELHHIEKHETRFYEFENKNHIYDLENIGEEIVMLHVSEFKQTFVANTTEIRNLINQ